MQSYDATHDMCHDFNGPLSFPLTKFPIYFNVRGFKKLLCFRITYTRYSLEKDIKRIILSGFKAVKLIQCFFLRKTKAVGYGIHVKIFQTCLDQSQGNIISYSNM